MRLYQLFVGIVVLLCTVLPSFGSDGFHVATCLTGGGYCLDGINGNKIDDGDGAIVVWKDGTSYTARFYSAVSPDSTTADGTTVIAPSTNGGTKRWHLTKVVSADTYADFVLKWASGTCSGYLKSDGTCDAGDNLGTSSYADIMALWGSCTGYLKSDGTCSTGGSEVGFDESGNYNPTGTWNFANLLTLSKVNSAGGSADILTLSGTLGVMSGSNTIRGLYINHTNPTSPSEHTGALNQYIGIALSNMANWGTAGSYGMYIGTGYSYGIANYSGLAQAARQPVYFYDATTTKYGALRAPNAVTTSYVVNLPDAAPGSAGTYLMTITYVSETEATISFTNTLTGLTLTGFTASKVACTDGSGNLTTCVTAITDGTNTFTIANGTASLSVAAGKTVNFSGTFTDGKLCTYTSSGNVIGCNTTTGTTTAVDNTATTYNVSVAEARANTFFLDTYAGTKTYVLPAAEAGMAVCIKKGQGVSQVLRVDTDGTDYIVKSNGARTSSAGDYYGATASASNQICLAAFDTTDWYVISEVGTWTEE